MTTNGDATTSGSNNDEDDREEDDLNALPVIIFNDDTNHNPIGENIKVIGKVEKVEDKKAKRYYTYIIAKAIRLQQRKKQSLTKKDIVAFKKFAGLAPIYKNDDDDNTTTHYIDRITLKGRLINMVAPNIICNGNKKFAQLLVAAGAPEDEYHRGRINELMIGPPGTGKTKLAKEAMKLRPNSRFVSGINTTGHIASAKEVLKHGGKCDPKATSLGFAADIQYIVANLGKTERMPWRRRLGALVEE